MKNLIVSEILAKKLNSVEAAVLLAYLEKQRNSLKEDTFIIYGFRIEEDLLLTKEKRIKLTKILTERGLIRVIRKGMPSKMYYSLNDSKISELAQAAI